LLTTEEENTLNGIALSAHFFVTYGSKMIKND